MGRYWALMAIIWGSNWDYFGKWGFLWALISDEGNRTVIRAYFYTFWGEDAQTGLRPSASVGLAPEVIRTFPNYTSLPGDRLPVCPGGGWSNFSWYTSTAPGLNPGYHFYQKRGLIPDLRGDGDGLFMVQWPGAVREEHGKGSLFFWAPSISAGTALSC